MTVSVHPTQRYVDAVGLAPSASPAAMGDSQHMTDAMRVMFS
jgi:hypothetical protein